MPEQHGYAVFLYDNALEALGACVTPYLCDGPQGKHLVCRDVDTAGSFVEMTLLGCDREGRETDLEFIVPTNMVKLIVSSRADAPFGFMPRPAGGLTTALPPLGPTASPVDAPSQAMPDSDAGPEPVQTPAQP
ncbi:hypothetical protein [Cognatilysobacter bugurensis]|uniref:Uncharacterized protein n=1 Tax=Cognatilysobacter bugurensis TaxID=543356 RepID=A0A918W4X8_9GAMM|nr:hypothetical protein [Lysobacter bugurensis]GHA69338.1 hypothetical protein GCM10007067_01590 [Lysobacter bugurensis]